MNEEDTPKVSEFKPSDIVTLCNGTASSMSGIQMRARLMPSIAPVAQKAYIDLEDKFKTELKELHDYFKDKTLVHDGSYDSETIGFLNNVFDLYNSKDIRFLLTSIANGELFTLQELRYFMINASNPLPFYPTYRNNMEIISDAKLIPICVREYKQLKQPQNAAWTPWDENSKRYLGLLREKATKKEAAEKDVKQAGAVPIDSVTEDVKQAGVVPIDSVTEDVKKLSFDIDAAKAVEESFQLTPKTELIGMRRLLGFEGTEERDEWKRIFYEDVAILMGKTVKNTNTKYQSFFQKLLQNVYQEHWSYSSYLNGNLIMLSKLHHMIENVDSYIALLENINNLYNSFCKQTTLPNRFEIIGFETRKLYTRYISEAFDRNRDIILRQISEMNGDTEHQTFLQGLMFRVYLNSFSVDEYVEDRIMSFDDLKDLINMCKTDLTVINCMMQEQKEIDKLVANEDVQKLTLGRNVKKIYDRSKPPYFPSTFDFATAKEAHDQDISPSRLNIRRRMLQTPLSPLAKMCATDACKTRADSRIKFFRDLRHIRQHVNLYDVLSKTPPHSILLNLANGYDEHKAFTQVLERKKLGLEQFKLLIKLVKQVPQIQLTTKLLDFFKNKSEDELETYVSVLTKRNEERNEVETAIREAAKIAANSEFYDEDDSDSERGGNPPRRRTKRRRLNKKKNATIIKKQNVRRRRRRSSSKKEKSNVGTNIQSRI